MLRKIQFFLFIFFLFFVSVSAEENEHSHQWLVVLSVPIVSLLIVNFKKTGL